MGILPKHRSPCVVSMGNYVASSDTASRGSKKDVLMYLSLKVSVVIWGVLIIG